MSLLFPLYLGGILAVSLPIVFHMIRRTPSGSVPFSSLMFLSKSPPRLVRRKRLEQIALLCLRALILGLLALAFARPYLRDESLVLAGEAEAGRVALLVDTSASMRRPDLWEAAQREARQALDDAPPGSRVTIFGFDDGVTEVDTLDELAPSWRPTDLGRALAEAAEHLQANQTEAGVVSTIVLVSDLQKGSELDELDDYDWPQEVELELRRVAGPLGNAALHPGPRRDAGEEASEEGELRVRVSNAADSRNDRFTLQWRDPASEAVGEELAIFCPPGDVRLVRAPARPASDELLGLVLHGDEAAFDNVYFDRPVKARGGSVLSMGGASDTDQDLDFFLENLFGDVEALGDEALPALDVATHPLVVLNPRGGDAASAAPLLEYVRLGGVLLVVLADSFDPAAASELVPALLDAPALELSEAETEGGFALIAEVDFDHSLFAPFADPRYSDFTSIRFWRHRSIRVDTASGLRVLASFDDGDPFLIERQHGVGSILVATSGWEPSDSDFARSSKFAPLLEGLLRLESTADLAAELFFIGDPVPLLLPEGVTSHVGLPNGGRIELDPGAELFTGTEMPGQYDLVMGDDHRSFVVYLHPEESRTEPLELDPLTRAGVRIARNISPEAGEERETRERQELGFELERRQQLWRWLIFAAVAGLLVETAWAGRLARKSEAEAS